MHNDNCGFQLPIPSFGRDDGIQNNSSFVALAISLSVYSSLMGMYGVLSIPTITSN